VILEFGENEVDAGGVEFEVEVDQHIGRGGVDVGYRLDGEQNPVRRRRGGGDLLAHQLPEQGGVGEKDRAVPAQHDQPGGQFGIRVARYVVVAGHAGGVAEDGVVGLPGAVEKLDDGQDDGDDDALE